MESKKKGKKGKGKGNRKRKRKRMRMRTYSKSWIHLVHRLSLIAINILAD